MAGLSDYGGDKSLPSLGENRALEAREQIICNFVTAEITKQSKYKPKRWGIS